MLTLLLYMQDLLLSVQDLTLEVTSFWWDKYLTQLLEKLPEMTEKFIGSSYALSIARNLAATCSLFYLGYEMWPVIMGRKAPDILSLIRPIMIAGILSIWPAFCTTLERPGKLLAESGKTSFQSQVVAISEKEDEIIRLETKLDSLLNASLSDVLAKRWTFQAMKEAEMNNDNTGENNALEQFIENMKTAFHNNPLTMIGGTIADINVFFYEKIGFYVESKLFWFFSHLIRYGASLWLGMYFFGMLLISVIGMAVLRMFGPILWALSLTDAFKDMWSQWMMKYINLSLYPFLAYIVMCYVNCIMHYELQLGVNAGKAAETYQEMFYAYQRTQVNVLGSYVLAMFIGCHCLRYVPELANMIFPNPGAGGSASGAGKAISDGTKTTAKVGMKVIGM